jgi:hypothetical protein
MIRSEPIRGVGSTWMHSAAVERQRLRVAYIRHVQAKDALHDRGGSETIQVPAPTLSVTQRGNGPSA